MKTQDKKNKTSKTNKTNGKVWRPLLFKSVSELQKKIDEYFDRCDRGKVITAIYKWEPVTYTKPYPYTITWLASWLWTNRQTLINYTNKEEYFDTIKRAKEKVEANLEENAILWEWNPTSTIFSLKNNFERKDKQEHEHTWSNWWPIEIKDYTKLSMKEIGEIRKNLLNN